MTDADFLARLEAKLWAQERLALQKLWAHERMHADMLDEELRRKETANTELRVQNRRLKDQITALNR